MACGAWSRVVIRVLLLLLLLLLLLHFSCHRPCS